MTTSSRAAPQQGFASRQRQGDRQGCSFRQGDAGGAWRTWARKQLLGLVKQTHELLEPYGEQAALLKAAASFVAIRNNRRLLRIEPPFD
jgi:hypothetical protein